MLADFPFLKTERLLLRQFLASDLDHVFQGLSHPEVIKYYGVSYKSLDDTKQQMEWFKDLENEGTGIWWAIHSADGENFYGAAGLNNLSMAHKKAEIGFWLLPTYWGKGITQEAILVICKYAFEQIKLHRIEALVEFDNKSCKNLMNKLNFKHEGTMQDCEVKNGNFISLDIYAKLNSTY